MKKRILRSISRMLICCLLCGLFTEAVSAEERSINLKDASPHTETPAARAQSDDGEASYASRTVEKDPLSASYEYHLESGQLKYRLDLGGESMRLHCYFRSGDPDYHEEIYTLPLDDTLVSRGTLVFGKVNNSAGIDIASQFAFFAITFTEQKAVLSAVRKDQTLAGGTEGSIMTGTYEMTARSGADDKGNAGEKSGKCIPSILCRMAQSYYFRHEGFYPPVADYTDNGDGTYTLHLYEVVDEGDGNSHTATSAWYTVDAGGVGTDGITGKEVNIRQ